MSEPTNQDIRDACATCVPEMDGVAYGFAGMCLILLKRHDALERALAAAQAEIERERMRLVACGVVAMSDTPDSAKSAREMHPDYRSATLSDVERRVDECIKLRADLAAAQAEAERVKVELEHDHEICDRLERERDEARAEAAALRVDAERYRWLREHGGKSYQETASQPSGMLPSIYVRLPSMNASGSYVLLGEQADAAIDQARKES